MAEKKEKNRTCTVPIDCQVYGSHRIVFNYDSSVPLDAVFFL